jgi:hypothetical protein
MDVPNYIQAAAAQGLRYYADGLGGSGLTDQTIREARALANGTATESKVIRANAWAKRHAVDLRAARNNDPNNDGYPGPGAVAHLLWGISPSSPARARNWFERTARAIREAQATALRDALLSTPPAALRGMDYLFYAPEGTDG